MLNKKIIPKGSTIAVALSGGKDSMVLLDLLKNSSSELNIIVKALNVEHGIRGESSVLDSLFVKNYCQENNVPLLQEKVDAISYSKQNGLSVEEGARKLRYEFFERAIYNGFCDFVATAHHLSDNVETILFNLFRGASPSGVVGICEKSRNGKIIRPLINCEKEKIDEYALKNSIPFVVDETNFSDEYSRNFLRLNVIPEIKKLFPEMERSIKRFSEILLEDNKFLDEQVKPYVKIEKDCVNVDFNSPNAIFARACILAMKEMQIAKDYVKAHIDGLIDLKTASTGKKISLLNSVVAIKDYSAIVFYVEPKIKEIEMPFTTGEFSVGEYTLIVKEIENTVNLREKGILFADAEKIPNGAKIRFRKNGDTFEKFGGGTKSLGDFLTDKKISLRKRDYIPVLAMGSEILAICGVEISNKVKVDENTKKIISLELKSF